MPPSLSSNSSQALPTFPSSLPLGSNTKENLAETAEKKTWKTRGQEPILALHSLNSGSDEALGELLVHSHSHLSLSLCDCSSHTDESEGKPSHASQGVFTPGAVPAATVPISGLEDQLRICWLAYGISDWVWMHTLSPVITVLHFVFVRHSIDGRKIPLKTTTCLTTD